MTAKSTAAVNSRTSQRSHEVLLVWLVSGELFSRRIRRSILLDRNFSYTVYRNQTISVIPVTINSIDYTWLSPAFLLCTYNLHFDGRIHRYAPEEGRCSPDRTVIFVFYTVPGYRLSISPNGRSYSHHFERSKVSEGLSIFYAVPIHTVFLSPP